MNKTTENLGSDLMHGWIKGWSNYIQNPKDDYPAIIRIAEKCSKIAGVSLDEEEGYMRIKAGLAKIAAFCRSKTEWTTFNLFFIDLNLQKVLLHMQACERATEAQKEKINEAGRKFTEHQLKQKQDEALRKKQQKESLIWAIENWDEYWEYSERVYIKTSKAVVLKYDEAKKRFLDISEENRNEIIEAVKSLKEEWQNELNKFDKRN